MLPSRRAREQSPAVAQRLTSARTAWCGTGAKDDGKLFAGSQYIPRQAPPGASIRLTPFGAYAIEPGKPNMLAIFEVADRYRVRSRQSDTGLMTVRGPCVLRPDPVTSLQPGGSVFVGAANRRSAKVVPREQWAQVPSTLRSAARAQGLSPAPVPPAAGAPGPAPPPCDGPVATQYQQQPMVILTEFRDDPCECSGTLECTIYNKVIMDYVGYRLCVPERWFWNRYEDDDWMSVNDTMEDLWRAVHNTGSGMTDAVLDDLIGCWMIDTDNDSHGRSYSMFFNDGNAPRKFLKYSLDLVRRFSHEIKDEWSGTTTCAGLREYIEDVLDGKKGSTLTDGVGPCTIRFLAVSETTWLPDERASRSCGDAGPLALECGGWTDGGNAFDDWSQVIEASGVELDGSADIYEMMVRSGFPANWAEPEAGYLGYAKTEGGTVLMPANRLAFRGYQFDYTMFWARVALEYAYDKGDWSAWYGSWVYTRAAMAYMMDYCRTLIHEMGHLHMGTGGHCAKVEDMSIACCFDIAAEHWKCRVASALGLPKAESLQCTADPLSSTSSNPCGAAGQGTYPQVCDRVALCSVEDAFYWAAPCSA